MDSAIKREADNGTQVKEEEVFIIDNKDEVKVDLARVRPLKIEQPIDEFRAAEAEPKPSTSRAAVLAEVRLHAPPPGPEDFKWDTYELAPRGNRLSPPPPPADRAKRRSVPGGHASATPRLKFSPYQTRR